MEHPVWPWVPFNIGILVLLFLDLVIFHKKAHEVKMKEAIIVSSFWVGIALLFNTWIWFQHGPDYGAQFLAGYLVEKSLSVDNLFVILLLFSGLKIPNNYQHRVLFWGVFGAIVMRAGIIIFGAHLVNKFEWILYIFGGILVITAFKFLKDEEEEVDVAKHWAVKILKKFYPITTKLHGQHFFSIEDGIKKATPLFVALVLIEISDLIFAVDSIPAVFSVTTDPFIAYSSNIMAILGLRALFFVIAHFVGKLRYLKPGLSVILGFVGTKMLIAHWFKIPSTISVLIITLILTTAALGSWYASRREEQRKR